jgi:hypothetical protein
MAVRPSMRATAAVMGSIVSAFRSRASHTSRLPEPLAHPPFQDELRALLAARRELGDEYEALLVERFLQQVERAIDARVEQLLAEYERRRLRTALVTTPRLLLLLLFAIPLTAIGGATAGLPGILAAWVGVLALHFLSWRR